MNKEKILELFVDCVKTALATGQGYLVNPKKFEEGLEEILNSLPDDKEIAKRLWEKYVLEMNNDYNRYKIDKPNFGDWLNKE